jgi:hypothetical protein
VKFERTAALMSRLSDASASLVSHTPVAFQVNDRIIINGIEQLKGVRCCSFAWRYRPKYLIVSILSNCFLLLFKFTFCFGAWRSGRLCGMSVAAILNPGSGWASNWTPLLARMMAPWKAFDTFNARKIKAFLYDPMLSRLGSCC